ncbi:MAG: efflux RND transporter periplasmic adaptor subunit [Saprospiraceae bacterium]|nr:efflux RND transporter periplasmic adaptor subunit [Saprospiraceae bacterium]
MRPLFIIFVIIIAMYLAKVLLIDGSKKEANPVVTTSEAEKINSSRLPVDIYVAREIDKSNTVYASGTVIPNEDVEIKSEVAGRLEKLHLREGGYIRKGELIAKINDDELKARLKKIEFEEELAEQTETRQKKLLEINAISKEEYDMAVNRVNTLSADKELLMVELAKTSIMAPFSGRMGLKNISEGAYVTPGSVISSLVQTNPAKLDFSIPEKYANKIKVGQNVSFTIDGDDEVMTAQVIAVDPRIDEDLRTLRIRSKTNNSDGRLLPGMFIRVVIPLGNERSIMVPSESIIPILKGKKLFVMKDGLAREVEVKTGIRTDTDVQIEEGISVGDSIIVSSLMAVQKNTPVAVRNVVE